MSAAVEHCKILSWKEGQYWRGQQLLPISQIRVLLAALQWKYEIFATIQNYDAEGNCLSCPIYMDLDGEPDHVLADARHVVSCLEFLLNITPRIYFSGSKGLHITVDYVVEHPRCHLIVQDFAREVAPPRTRDDKVYRTYSMFRIPGSIASVPGFYKIEITRDELFTLTFDEIKELARTQRMIDSGASDADEIDTVLMRDWVKIAIERLPRYDSVAAFTERHADLAQDFTPCLRHMLAEGVDQGRRNEAMFILAKFFKSAGMDMDSASELILANDAWRTFEKEGREVTKVLRSVYRGHRVPRIGCRGESSNAELMRAYCSNRCFLAENFVELTAVDDRKK